MVRARPPSDVAEEGSQNWTVTLNSLTATAAHLEIAQAGTVVFCRNYTLGGPAIGTTSVLRAAATAKKAPLTASATAKERTIAAAGADR